MNNLLSNNFIIVLLFAYLIYLNMIPNFNKCPQCPKCPECNCQNKYNKESYSNYLYRQLFDPLSAPTKYFKYFPRFIKSYPTQYIPPYGLIGNVTGIVDNKTKILQLFGRPENVGSSRWEYYLLEHLNNKPIKMEVDSNKELYDGNIVNVREYNGVDFKLNKFNNEGSMFRYTPYI